MINPGTVPQWIGLKRENLRGGGQKYRWGHISQQLFAFILLQYISNFPFPLGAYQFPASISFHT